MANILLLFLSFFHPFYVSVTEVNHNAKTNTLEISTKIFFDDLEVAVEKESNVKFDILKPNDKKTVDALLASYLNKHLKISVNNKSVGLKYLGFEIQEEAVWCYLEVPKVGGIKQISIMNDVLFAVHKEQINMLHVTVNTKRQSTKLDAPDSNASFTF